MSENKKKWDEFDSTAIANEIETEAKFARNVGRILSCPHFRAISFVDGVSWCNDPDRALVRTSSGALCAYLNCPIIEFE